MQEGDVLLQVLLRFLQDPPLEVDELEGVAIVDVVVLEPVDEVGEVVGDLLPDEYPVDHVAAEQPHLDLVAQVRVDLLVLVDAFEDVGGGRPVGELQVVEGFLYDVEGVAFLEVFDGHVLQHVLDQGVSVFEHELSFELLLLELVAVFSVLFGCHAFLPHHRVDPCVAQAVWHFLGLETLAQRLCVE